MSEPVTQQIANIALMVADYDNAIAFYTQKLQFTLLQNIDMGNGQRWVQISPPNSNGANLVLVKASDEQQNARVGKQTGGPVFLFLQTNDFWRDYNSMQANGVIFDEAPREEDYGTVAVFHDLYGNKWDLIQPK